MKLPRMTSNIIHSIEHIPDGEIIDSVSDSVKSDKEKLASEYWFMPWLWFDTDFQEIFVKPDILIGQQMNKYGLVCIKNEMEAIANGQLI